MSFMSQLANPKRVALVATTGAVGLGLYYKNNENALLARNWHSNVHMKYPASANFPDLSQHNNLLAEHLTPGVGIHITV